MYTDTYNLVDNKGNVRATKYVVGHIQSAFSVIKSNEEITYPWKVVSSNAKDILVIDENTTQDDWRKFNIYCSQLL